MKVKSIVVLVELENGNCHQVLTTNQQKEAALSILVSSNGKLTLSDEIEPIKFEIKNKS